MMQANNRNRIWAVKSTNSINILPVCNLVNTILSAIICTSICVSLYACSELSENSEKLNVIKLDDYKHNLNIENWKVIGPFSLFQDSIIFNKFVKCSQLITMAENPDTTIKIWHNGFYHPKYGQLDLKEVYDIHIEDTTKILDSLTTYMECRPNMQMGG